MTFEQIERAAKSAAVNAAKTALTAPLGPVGAIIATQEAPSANDVKKAARSVVRAGGRIARQQANTVAGAGKAAVQTTGEFADEFLRGAGVPGGLGGAAAFTGIGAIGTLVLGGVAIYALGRATRRF